MTEISCDRCISPGACCKAFHLSLEFPLGSTPLDVLTRAKEEGLPFIPLHRSGVYNGSNSLGVTQQHWYEQWTFSCPELTPEGLCGIYDKRPSVCQIYEPGMDAMCTHMRLPNGEPIIPLLPILQ